MAFLNEEGSKYIIEKIKAWCGGSKSLTQAEYDELEAEGKIDSNTTYYITDAATATAQEISYDNSTTELGDGTIQGAIDDINTNVNTLSDSVDVSSIPPTLGTTVGGAISSLDSKLSNNILVIKANAIIPQSTQGTQIDIGFSLIVPTGYTPISVIGLTNLSTCKYIITSYKTLKSSGFTANIYYIGELSEDVDAYADVLCVRS